MLSRRTFGSLVGAAACAGGAAASSASSPTLDLDTIPLTAHEAAMRLAITAAKANPFYPFGAVIIGAAGPRSAGAGREQEQDQSGPPRRNRRDQRLCRAPRQPGLGRQRPIHHWRTLPDVHERHCLGRHRRGFYGSSITMLAEVGIAQIMIGASAV